MKALQQKKTTVPMIALLAFMAAIIAGLCAQHFTDNGNPGTESEITKAAYEYVQQIHPDIADRVEMNINSVNFSKDGSSDYPFPYWTVYFFDRMGDIRFDLVYDNDGNLVSDGYETWYLAGGKAYSDRAYEYSEYINTVELMHNSRELTAEGLFYKTMDYSSITTQDYYRYTVSADYKGPLLTPGEKRDFKQLAETEGYIDVAMWYGYGDTAQFAAMVTDVISQLDEKDINWHSARFAWWCGKEKEIDAYYILNIDYDSRHSDSLQQYITDNAEFTDMRE